MASDKQPRADSFLAAIEAKVAAWKAVADSYRTAVSIDGPLDVTVALRGVEAATGVGQLQGYAEMQLPVGVFRDKSLKEAIPIYLSAGRRKQTNKEIAIGLKAGGFPTTADNFEATVATALYRLKNDGVILRFQDGWDVAESYPDNMRSRLEKDPTPKRKSAKRVGPRRGNRRQGQQQKIESVAKKRAKDAAAAGTIKQAIAALLDAGTAYSPKTIATETKMNAGSIRKKLQEMLQQGQIRRNEDGTYQIVLRTERLKVG